MVTAPSTHAVLRLVLELEGGDVTRASVIGYLHTAREERRVHLDQGVTS